jgi:hypothetical protein
MTATLLYFKYHAFRAARETCGTCSFLIQWLIPPGAGLCRSGFVEETFDSPVFDLSLQSGGLAQFGTLSGPNESPGAGPALGGARKGVSGVVVLAQASIHIRALAAELRPLASL